MPFKPADSKSDGGETGEFRSEWSGIRMFDHVCLRFSTGSVRDYILTLCYSSNRRRRGRVGSG